MKDHQAVVKMISEAFGVSNGTVTTILAENLKLHKVWPKLITNILSNAQKLFCMDILYTTEADSGFLNKVVHWDEG